ncbi:MAG: FIST N-terminal domain-containing protein [Myxococcota bacterium]
MRTVSAHANDPETGSAIADLMAEAERGLNGAIPIAGLLFAGIDVDHPRVLAAIADRWPDLALIGCTTDGEISSTLAFQEDSLALFLFVGGGLIARVGVGTGLARDPAAAARQAAAEAGYPGVPRLCVALPESLQVDGVPVVAAVNAALPAGTVVVGGTAGDRWQFRATRQFCGRRVVEDSVPLLLLGGAFEVGVGIASGWTPLGRIGRVTAGEGPLVREIDHAPAVEFYRQYLGHHVEPNPEYPILILEEDDGPGYLRAPFRYDADTGAIVFAADVPAGAGLQVTAAPSQGILDACAVSVERALAGSDLPVVGAFAVSCAARKQILGTRTANECRILRDAIGPDVPVIGFYAYGEIAPLGAARTARFHNETFVTVVFRSVPDA